MFEDLANCLHRRAAAKRRRTGQRLVKHRAQAVHVGRGGDIPRVSTRLLGRHVGRCAQDRVRVRQRAVFLYEFGQTEVSQVRLALGIKQNVAGLEIAMQHTTLMSIVNGVSESADKFD